MVDAAYTYLLVVVDEEDKHSDNEVGVDEKVVPVDAVDAVEDVGDVEDFEGGIAQDNSTPRAVERAVDPT